MFPSFSGMLHESLTKLTVNFFFRVLNQFPLLSLVTLPSSFHGGPPRRAWFCSAIRPLLCLLLPRRANLVFSDVPHTLGAPVPNHLGSPLVFLPCGKILQMDYGRAEYSGGITFLFNLHWNPYTQSFKLTSICYYRTRLWPTWRLRDDFEPEMAFPCLVFLKEKQGRSWHSYRWVHVEAQQPFLEGHRAAQQSRRIMP